MSDFSVKIVCKDRNMKETGVQNFDFEEYTQMIKLDLMKIIMYVEDAFFKMLNESDKTKWPEDIMGEFNRIRHRILDSANAVERLPKNLQYKNRPCLPIPSDEWIAKYVDEATKEKQRK